MKNSYAAYYKSKAYSQKYMQIFVCKCNVVIVMRHQQPIVTNKLQVLEFSTWILGKQTDFDGMNVIQSYKYHRSLQLNTDIQQT